ncbi:MAG: mannose-6-phosphate isomerase, class I [Actinomycetota bacterium]
MHRITGVIRDYDWGDREVIAAILGHEAPGHPEAEYWLGAHPSAPSTVQGSGCTLDVMIDRSAATVMGAATADRFGQLPFLLKILAAAKPLSIQAHPSLVQARVGFAREDAAGIDRAAPNRNYRDDNHKPELICAVTPFEAKCGFRALAETLQLLGLFSGSSIDHLIGHLSTADQKDGEHGDTAVRIGATGQPDADAAVLSDAVRWLLELPADEAGDFAAAVVAQAAQLLERGQGESGADPPPFRRELEWVVRTGAAFPGDIGVVVALLLNHVSLAPGQAMFLEAGNLHSYLSGTGIELMANSDNVLRGGLTPKHVDVEELLAVVDYRPGAAPVQTPDGPIHRYRSPVPEFSLTRLGGAGDTPGGESFGVGVFGPDGPSVVLVTAGLARLESGSDTLELAKGDAVFVAAADGPFRLTDVAPGETLAWVATVGDTDR